MTMETRHKRVIAFSLWGDSDRYLVGAIENAKLAKTIYPEWECWFYVPCPQESNSKLERTICELFSMDARMVCWIEGIAGMYQRFLIADDPTVEYFAVRDADSRLSMREKLAVDQFIESGKILHSMRDHGAHCRGLNGGLWSAKGGCLPDMETSIRDWLLVLKRQGKTEFSYGEDQEFLGRYIWTRFYMHSMQHDSCCGYADALPFPTKRDGYRFVGEVFESDGTPRKHDWEAIKPNS